MRLQMIENETRRREKKTNKTTKKKIVNVSSFTL